MKSKTDFARPKMPRKKRPAKQTPEARYYDKHGVLKEIADKPVQMSLEIELRRAILTSSPFRTKR